MRTITLCCLVCLTAGRAGAQQADAEGSKDHPMFSRMPGYYIEEYDAQDFAGYDLNLDPQKRVEGKFWRIHYILKEGARKAGPLQIGRNYTDLVVKRGGKKLLEALEVGGGNTVAQLPVGGKNIWVEVDVASNGEVYDLIVVEEAALQQQVEFTATELADALNAKGSIALHNILFDTGKATLKTESAAALSTIADVLKSDASLKLEIQGHTDKVGMPAANLKLSQDRAAAVKAYLVQTLGADPSRLTTAGFGDTKPIGDNTTEEGRALNRRVELVKK